MKHWKHSIFAGLAFLAAAIAQTSCNGIDDDLSDCGKDVDLTYRMRLVTNMQQEIDSVLCEPQDQPVAELLRQTMGLFFNDRGHDLALSFYDALDGSRRKQLDNDMQGATQASYTIYLDLADYRHTAIANVAQNGVVSWTGVDMLSGSSLNNPSAATVDSHATGIFTGRCALTVANDKKKLSGTVDLFMANDAAAVVIDTTGVSIQDMTVYIDGLATGFSPADSLYHYDRQQTVNTTLLPVSQGHEVCYYGMGFPSPDMPTRADGTPYYWRMRVYVTLPDGSVTENTLSVNRPLRAGQLKIIKLRLKDDGEVTSVNAEVGVGVELNWKDGPHFEK